MLSVRAERSESPAERESDNTRTVASGQATRCSWGLGRSPSALWIAKR